LPLFDFHLRLAGLKYVGATKLIEYGRALAKMMCEGLTIIAATDYMCTGIWCDINSLSPHGPA